MWPVSFSLEIPPHPVDETATSVKFAFPATNGAYFERENFSPVSRLSTFVMFEGHWCLDETNKIQPFKVFWPVLLGDLLFPKKRQRSIHDFHSSKCLKMTPVYGPQKLHRFRLKSPTCRKTPGNLQKSKDSISLSNPHISGRERKTAQKSKGVPCKEDSKESKRQQKRRSRKRVSLRFFLRERFRVGMWGPPRGPLEMENGCRMRLLESPKALMETLSERVSVVCGKLFSLAVGFL